MGSRDIATPFLTLTLDGGERSASRLCRSILALGAPKNQSELCRDDTYLSLPGDQTPAVKPYSPLLYRLSYPCFS
jgi:hypothetical protein